MPAPVFIPMNSFRPDGGAFGDDLSLVQNALPVHGGWLSLRKKQPVVTVADGPMTGAYVHIYQQAVQLQEAGPSADIQVGGWAASGGAGSTLFDKINEVSPSDSEFIFATGAPLQSTTLFGIVQLPALVDPASGADHYFRWRYRIPSTTGAWTLNAILADQQLAVTSITRVGSTATATTDAAHGLATGQVVYINGANQAEYNIRATITVTGASTFTYTVSGSPATPATGTIMYRSEWALDQVTGTGVVAAFTQRERLLTAGEANAIVSAGYGRFRFMVQAVVAGAAQFGRPASDVALGGWTTQAGGTSNLFQAIDEASASDTDYLLSAVLAQGGAADIYAAGLGTIVDPMTDSGFTLRYRIRGSNAGVNLKGRLKQGSTVIKETTHTGIGTSFVTQAVSLSAGEMAAVTDFSALRFEAEAAWPSAVTSTAQQSARVTADVFPNGWETESAGTSNIYQSIDEASPSDSDYITPGSPAAAPALFTLATPDGPGTTADHALKVRASSSDTGASLVVRIFSDGVLAKQYDFGGGVGPALSSTPTTFSLALTAGEASLLNYAALTFEVEGTGTNGGAGTVRVYWMELAVPEQRWAEVSWAELETPSPARAEVSWSRVQIPAAGQVYKGDVPTVFCGSQTKLYEVTAAAFTDRSKGGGYGAGAKPGAWRGCSFGNDPIFTNRSDPVQYRADNSGAFADLITSSAKPNARFVATVRDHVVLADINLANYFPDQVWWSAIDNARVFDDQAVTRSPQTQSDQQRIVSCPGQIMGIVGGDYGVIFKRNSMHLMGWQGGSVVFRFDDISRKLGTPLPSSIVATPYGIFFFDGSTFRRYNGGTGDEALVDIGTGLLSQFLTDVQFSTGYALAQIEPSDIAIEDQLMIGHYDPFARLIVWTYQNAAFRAGDSLVNPLSYQHTRGIVYNPAEDRWGVIFDGDLLNAILATKPNVTNSDSFLLKGSVGFDWNGTSTAYYRFDSATTYSAQMTSKRQALGIANLEEGRAPAAVRLVGLLPVFSHVAESSAVPAISVVVSASNDPFFVTDFRQKTITMSQASSQGVLPVDITGTWFKLDTTIPELSAQALRAFRGFYAFSEEVGRPGG